MMQEAGFMYHIDLVLPHWFPGSSFFHVPEDNFPVRFFYAVK